MSKYGYLEVVLEGPFDFEIMRVDCNSSLIKSPITWKYQENKVNYLFIYLFIHNFMTTYTYKYIHVPMDWT